MEEIETYGSQCNAPEGVRRGFAHNHSRIIRGVEPRFLARAIELALHNAETNLGGPFGAVVVKDGVIVGEGFNQVTTNNDPTAHAEVVAIRKACETLGVYQIPGAELYTSCEPCPMCLGAIYWTHLDCVYYAATQFEAAQSEFDDSFIYQQIAVPPAERKIPMHHIAMEHALAPFRAWLRNPQRIRY